MSLSDYAEANHDNHANTSDGKKAAENRLDECPLLGEQLTCSGNAATSAFDPSGNANHSDKCPAMRGQTPRLDRQKKVSRLIPE